MHDDKDRSFDAILLPKQRPSRALLTIRSEPIADDVRVDMLWDVLLDYQCSSL